MDRRARRARQRRGGPRRAWIVGWSLVGTCLGGCATSGVATSGPGGPTPAESPRGANDRAERVLGANRFDEAIAICRSSLEKHPADPGVDARLRFQLARAYWGRADQVRDLGGDAGVVNADREAALQEASNALITLETLRDDTPFSLCSTVGRSLGSWLRSLGRVDTAIDAYDRMLRVPGGKPLERSRILFERGNAYLDRGGRRGDSGPTADAHRQDLDAATRNLKDALQLVEPLQEQAYLLVARIHNALGLVYRAQLLPGPAAEQFAQAERICGVRSLPAQQAPVLANLILALIEAGRTAEARERCIQLQALPHVGARPQTLAALGVAFLRLGDYSEATRQLDLARFAARENPEARNDPSFMAQLAINAATCAQAVGAFDEAERYLVEVNRSLESGEVDPRTAAVARANLGRMYLTLERLDEAETQLEAVLGTVEALQGPQHPDTLMLQLDLANLARLRGHLVEAEQRYRAVLKGLVAVRGEDHPMVARARMELASLYRDREQCPEALDEMEKALDVLDARLGAEHKESVVAYLQGALIAADCQDLPRGEALFRTLRSEAARRFGRFHDRFGPENPEVLRAMVYFADVSARTPTARDRALARYRDAEKGFLELYGDGVLSLAALRLKQGKLLERMGRGDEALRVYDRARRLMDRGLSSHPVRAEILVAMGDLHRARDQLDRAKPLWREAYRILSATYGPDHPRVSEFRKKRREQ